MEMVSFTVVHLLAPLAGLQLYRRLCRRMQAAKVEAPPAFAFFLLFVTYGGALLLLLTRLFWHWSGAALVGLVYLLFLAPVILAVVAFLLSSKRAVSPYHRAAFVASLGYLLLSGLGWAMLAYWKVSGSSL